MLSLSLTRDETLVVTRKLFYQDKVMLSRGRSDNVNKSLCSSNAERDFDLNKFRRLRFAARKRECERQR